MKPIMASRVSWLAPTDAQLGDWVLVPGTIVAPVHWAQITALESNYEGVLRSVIAHQKSAPTEKQLKELVSIYDRQP